MSFRRVIPTVSIFSRSITVDFINRRSYGFPITSFCCFNRLTVAVISGGGFPQKNSPELNPIERLWEHLKAALKWASFRTLAQLQAKVDQLLAQLLPEVIASVTGYSFILDALSVVNTI